MMSTVSANDRDDLAGEFRRPSKAEDRIIQLLLSSEFPGAPALREQMSKALVRRIDAVGSLEISSGDGPHAAVVRRVPSRRKQTTATASRFMSCCTWLMD